MSGNSGHTSLTLSHNVITRSNRSSVNRSSDFVSLREMSIPRAAITRTAFACSVFGLLPALHARTAPSDRRSISASAIWERELLPVQRKSTRSGRVVGASLAAKAPVAAKSGAVLLEVEAVVGVAPVERAAVRSDETARAEQTQVVRDEVLRLADRVRELADAPVRGSELGEQAPADRMTCELEEDRRPCLHVPDITSN